ncbi:hypothetical protein F5876DRAFT_85808 [Lentinula aff. lateritia]|uniref:Uncharacterized protein n=1 Tax=Lentinula aff. lateritia TaxID=2804960 RepID=A0ACC1UE13_9AGAR|nr:hypothetical protein F5876DRAFT_85808 [Lentinula aff. lateritia]
MSIVGWLKDASVTLEYRKNYEEFWNCKSFVKQLRKKFFPAFRAAHGPGYIAVVLVDNSQEHAAYAKNALRVSEMGFCPGGKQCQMQDDKNLINQCYFHLTIDQPKGMQQVLIEQGLWKSGLYMKCKGECSTEVEQKSLVQKVIKEAGEFFPLFVTCICCTKFIQGICVSFSQNFIKYFWGAVKCHFCEHCDYTFQTLCENMPKALASIKIDLI